MRGGVLNELLGLHTNGSRDRLSMRTIEPRDLTTEWADDIERKHFCAVTQEESFII